MEAQEAIARSFLARFESAALQKVERLKRARKVEFEDYMKKLDGPVVETGKRTCLAVETGLKETIERGRVRGMGREGKGCDGTEGMEARCKRRWSRGDRSLEMLDQCC